MSKDGNKENEPVKKKLVLDGYQPDVRKGYKPEKGSLDTSKPPQGGSGVPNKSSVCPLSFLCRKRKGNRV